MKYMYIDLGLKIVTIRSPMRLTFYKNSAFVAKMAIRFLGVDDE